LVRTAREHGFRHTAREAIERLEANPGPALEISNPGIAGMTKEENFDFLRIHKTSTTLTVRRNSDETENRASDHSGRVGPASGVIGIGGG
jgi:hypothetical protein